MSAQDLLVEVGNPGTATTLSAPGYTAGDTTINVAATTNWPTTGKAVIFAIDEAAVVDGVEVQVAGTYNEFEGTTASATSVSNVDQKRGVGDRNYAAGSLTRVYIPVSSERENRIVEWGLVHGNQDGTLKTNSITTANITDSNVTTSKLADASVTPAKVSNTYKFRVTRNAAQNSSATAAPLLCDTKSFDTGTNVDIVTNKGRFTAPVAGYYQFNGRFKVAESDNGFVRTVLYVNGTQRSAGNIVRSGGAATTIAAVLSDFIQLNAFDYVELYVQSASTTALDVNNGENYFSGFLVSIT